MCNAVSGIALFCLAPSPCIPSDPQTTSVPLEHIIWILASCRTIASMYVEGGSHLSSWTTLRTKKKSEGNTRTGMSFSGQSLAKGSTLHAQGMYVR